MRNVDRAMGKRRASLLGAPVDVLGLSVRASNCLRRLGVARVEDLVRLRGEDLLRVPNLGRGTLEHIGAALHRYGLKLGAVEDHSEALGVGEEHAMNWDEVVGKLPISDRTWMVLDGRFGVGRQFTLRTLADRIGVTRERVRQVQEAALDVLNKKVNQLAPWLNKVEELLGEQASTSRIEADATSRLILMIQNVLNRDSSDESVHRLLVVVRALASAGSVEMTWPLLSFQACILSPPIKGHAQVRKQLEEDAAVMRERTRQWTYRELALHVLREEQGPLHWREIAERCEGMSRRAGFSASSCFNQLQADRELFVRIGQGTYALAEWGFDRSETLNDLIASFLFESRECLAYGEILHRSSARQQVKASSVQMTLDLHPRFYRSVNGKYGLRSWLPSRDAQTLRTPKDFVETDDSRRRVRSAEAKGYNVTRMVSEDRKRNLQATLNDKG